MGTSQTTIEKNEDQITSGETISIRIKRRHKEDLIMTTDLNEPFSSIAAEYTKTYDLSSGISLKYKGVEIKGEDTPKSLGLTNESIIHIDW
jgi:hypothetical protein